MPRELARGDRRAFLKTLLAVMASSGFSDLGAQTAPFRRVTHGCCISRSEFDHYASGTRPTVLYMSGKEPIISNSGNHDFDMALAESLADLSNTFDVVPGFAYYDDTSDGYQAFANPDDKRLQRQSGTVLFGKRLLAKLLAQEDGDVAVLGVCAHEFAHIVQFKKNLQPSLMLPGDRVKLIELHADYLAGYYGAVRKKKNKNFPVVQFAVLAHSLGDFNNDAQHHGTPRERDAAIQEGFSAYHDGNLSFDDAVIAGKNYVLNL